MSNKPKRLMYPTGLIDRRVGRLQRDLRLLYRRIKRGELSRIQADASGQFMIRESFKVAERDIKVWLEKHGLRYEGDHSELNDALENTLKLWRGVVTDF